jgi:integrase
MARRNSYQRGSVDFKNGRWTIRYLVRVAGQWRNRRKVLEASVKTEKEALVIRDRFMREVNSRVNDPRGMRPQVTFDQFTRDHWLQYLDRRQVRRTTRASYDSMLKQHVLPAIGSARVDEIAPSDIAQLIGSKSGKYALNLYALLNVMFSVACDLDFINTNPVRKSLHRPRVRVKRKPAMKPECLRRVLLEIPGEYRLIFVTAAITGLRRGELMGLQWRDFDEEQQSLAIVRTYTRGEIEEPKTEASIRTLRIPGALVQLLKQHWSLAQFKEPSDFIFARSDALPYDADHLRRVVLYPAMERAGIERKQRSHGFHLFRHSAASIVHSLTSDLKLAQELLGHATIATTADIYTHLLDEAKAGAATELLASEFIQ